MLDQRPCRAKCSWSRQHRPTIALPIFRCSGCGSQWARTERWTPRNADGTITAEVQQEAALREAGSRRPARGAGAAGSAGS
jgi:hypothetical protein